jgi:argininosuccinate lyase
VTLWGGNYSGAPDRLFWELNRSLPVDRRLIEEEVAASVAYVRALGRAGCLAPEDGATLERGLQDVLGRIRKDPRLLEGDHEDVHSLVEALLQEAIGDLAGQAHIGRSRNEQAVTALRLFVLKAIGALCGALGESVSALVERGREGAEAVMPGFTHTRCAEPITFGHWAGAHAWALVRDVERFAQAQRLTSVLPLGSGALAGSSLPIDREALAQELGFRAVSPNALDAVSDRDFASDFVFACAQAQTHLSRLAEDLIWFSGPEFGFFELPEAFTTGSSLMPQKKNPDALELIRGKAARLHGDLVRMLTLQKGLATGYQKDLQEDKEGVFDAFDTLLSCLVILPALLRGLRLDRAAMARACGREEMMAAGLAVALAREGVPFRKAHGLVGSFVAQAQKEGAGLKAVAARELGRIGSPVASRLDAIFDPAQAVASKAVPGGTAPQAVRVSLQGAVTRLGELSPQVVWTARS